MVMTPWVGLSLMPEDAFRTAAAPLLASGEVDALEWSFDMGFQTRLPAWLEALLDHYGAAGRLFGHGVHYSALSATWEARQERWLRELRSELEARSYVHMSEHFGFMTAPPFVRGAPLPPPRADVTLGVGRDRLRRLRELLDCPLGLENLALAWNRTEALAHGAFLDALLEDPGDFLVLDVHNLYCQALNFGIPPDQLLQSLPLERAREIHVSGGSWLSAWPHAGPLVRCDTHDERVPTAVFALLRAALDACPNVRVVIFERLGHTLVSEPDAEQFRADFRQVAMLAKESRALAPPRTPAAPVRSRDSSPPLAEADVEALAQFQAALLTLLAEADRTESELRARLAEDPAFAAFRGETAAFDGNALGIAARVVRKWARREAG